MNYNDPIYGRFDIHESVLVELLQTAAVQRLHGVLQHGITALIGITEPITRFDHSVGAMLLVRQLGGDVREQIAALLHDVSHTAFSHVIDHVFGSARQQSYHDEVKEEYLTQTDVPGVLGKYGYDWHDFLDESRYPLLEQPAPALCADRLDYFLRDAVGLNLAQLPEVTAVLPHLIVGMNGRIVTDNVETARWLAITYLAADKASWANFREVGLYELTAQAIKRGLDIGAISQADIWTTDAECWQKLHQTDDPELQRLLGLVSPETEFVWDETDPTFRVRTKLRTIDPDVQFADGRIRPLSALDPNYAQTRQDYLHSRGREWPMRVV